MVTNNEEGGLQNGRGQVKFYPYKTGQGQIQDFEKGVGGWGVWVDLTVKYSNAAYSHTRAQRFFPLFMKFWAPKGGRPPTPPPWIRPGGGGGAEGHNKF